MDKDVATSFPHLLIWSEQFRLVLDLLFNLHFSFATFVVSINKQWKIPITSSSNNLIMRQFGL